MIGTATTCLRDVSLFIWWTTTAVEPLSRRMTAAAMAEFLSLAQSMIFRTPLMAESVVADEAESAEAVTVAARAGGAVWMAWAARAVVRAAAGMVAPLAEISARSFSMAR